MAHPRMHGNVLRKVQLLQFSAKLLDPLSIAQVWYVKYTRLFWRPITAINQGDSQNTADTSWTPFLTTPPHPE